MRKIYQWFSNQFLILWLNFLIFKIQIIGFFNYLFFRIFHPDIINQILDQPEFVLIDRDLSRIKQRISELGQHINQIDRQLYWGNPDLVSIDDVRNSSKMEAEKEYLEKFVKDYQKEKFNLLLQRLSG